MDFTATSYLGFVRLDLLSQKALPLAQSSPYAQGSHRLVFPIAVGTYENMNRAHGAFLETLAVARDKGLIWE